MTPLTPETIEVEFRRWWAESYPAAPPNSRAIEIAVAFVLYLQEQHDPRSCDAA
jgi:hypothetical protein